MGLVLNNKSKLMWYVNVELEMDNGETKSQVIQVGDYINITFMYDYKRITRQGKVTAINPSRIIEGNFYRGETLSAIIDLDASEQYCHKLYKVDIASICDINRLEETADSNNGCDCPKCNGNDESTDVDVEVKPDDGSEPMPIAGVHWEFIEDLLKD